MKIEKRLLASMDSCYAAASFTIGDKNRILLASEGRGGTCFAWDAPEYQEKHAIWEGSGGTMSIVPIPGSSGEFLAVQKFFQMYQWEEAKVVHVKPLGNNRYDITEMIHLPYIHRFDLLTVGDRHYFIGCTLATTKNAIDDWSKPGKIWVGEYIPGKPLELSILKEGLTQNHGYSRLVQDGLAKGLVTCKEGAFEITPPQHPGEPWTVTQFMNWPISDISAIDIDGDGELEFATIETFHGQYFRIYKKINGVFEKIFEHPEITEFYHVVVGAKLAGKPVFIGGCRRGKQQLFYVAATRKSPLSLEAFVIEEGVGPSNVYVINESGRDIIISANREIGEAALYIVSH